LFCLSKGKTPRQTIPRPPSCRSRAASIAFGDFRSTLYAPAFPSAEKETCIFGFFQIPTHPTVTVGRLQSVDFRIALYVPVFPLRNNTL